MLAYRLIKLSVLNMNNADGPLSLTELGKLPTVPPVLRPGLAPKVAILPPVESFVVLASSAANLTI